MEELPELTIGEVARRAGVATSSIRYYERIALLPKPERVGGQRRYTTDVLGKLGFIGVAQSAGFKLAEINELIEGVDSSGGMADQMRTLSARKLDEVEALLERTNAMKGWLEVAKGVRLRDARRVRASTRPKRRWRTSIARSVWSRWAARTAGWRSTPRLPVLPRPYCDLRSPMPSRTASASTPRPASRTNGVVTTRAG